METPLATTDALLRHPAQVEEVVQDLNRKLGKAKLAAVAAQDLSWAYVWATRIGGPDGGAISLSLQGSVGRRGSYAHLGTLGKGDARPPEIVAKLNPPPIITMATPHTAVLDVSNPNTGTTDRHLVVAGYAKKKVRRLLAHQLGATQDSPMLYTVTQQGVWWAGGLHRSALEALMACPEGGTWTWRRAAFQRLDAAAIQALIPRAPMQLLGVDGG